MANRKVSGMDLSPALARLRAHAAPGLDPHEAAMVEDAVSFIGSHPECLWRRCLDGHLTGSAWIESADLAWTLLTHHHKLDKWLHEVEAWLKDELPETSGAHQQEDAAAGQSGGGDSAVSQTAGSPSGGGRGGRGRYETRR